jgi:hypothetical protein
MGLLEARDEVSRRPVVDAAAELGCRDRESDGKMCFADPGWPEEDDVLLPFYEAGPSEILDLLAFDGRLEAEVEIGQQFHCGQSAATHRRLQTAVVAQADLCVEHRRDGVSGVQLSAVHAGEHVVECLQ